MILIVYIPKLEKKIAKPATQLTLSVILKYSKKYFCTSDTAYILILFKGLLGASESLLL